MTKKSTTMKHIHNLFIVLIALVITSGPIYSQDNRTLDTRVADLMVQMPADNLSNLNEQMGAMQELGDAGLHLVLDMIIPPGTGDDTKPRFAIESFSRYLSAEGRESEKKSWESMIIDEINKQEDPFVKSFLISQLYYIGSDATIQRLERYLTIPQLQDQVIRAMRDANPDMAADLFTKALDRVTFHMQIALINAIGEVGNEDHAPSVAALIGTKNSEVRRSVLACLAALGHPDSYKTLMVAAKSVDFMPEPTNATVSLLSYAKTISEKNNRALSIQICQVVTKKCKTPEQVHFKTGALIVAAGNDNIESSVTLLVDAMKSNYKEHRMAAVNYAAMAGSPVDPWITALQKTRKSEVKSEILYLFGMLGNPETSDVIISYLSDENPSVRQQAAKSLALIEKDKAVNDLLSYTVAYPAPPDTETARDVLLQTVGKDQVKIVIQQVENAPEGAKVVLTQVIAAKGDPKNFNVLYNLTGEEGAVRKAAIENMYQVSSAENLNDLLILYDQSADSTEWPHLEKAVVVSANSSSDKSTATRTILEHAREHSTIEKYIGILASVGGEEALNAVYTAYKNGDNTTKKRALTGLVKSTDILAASALFEICSTLPSGSEKKLVFDSYVKLVYSSSLPDDQKLLLLRKIEPHSPDMESTGLFIWSVGGVKTFLSFITLSGYLEDEALNSQAANALVRVVLPSQGLDNGFEGKMVQENLIRARDIISGPDTEYLKIDIQNYLDKMSDQVGFVSMFNGSDLSGWQGLAENPVKKAGLSPKELEKKQQEANDRLKENWSVKDNFIVFNGDGSNLCSIKEYGSFEMVVDWRITKKGDSGIYLRGSPQVQIWDTSRVDAGAQVGSGGLYNNQTFENKPLVVADNPVGDWNTFHITMVDERVTVYLNGQLVVDDVVMENYWDRSIPIFPTGSIELQAHGSDLAFRDIYVKELVPPGNMLTREEKADGFVSLFNGIDLSGWAGNEHSYLVEDGVIVIRPTKGGGNLYTGKAYSDFIFRFEFKLTPGANNGLGVRTPMKGDAAYVGYELQILDNTAAEYDNLEPYQFHGSVYGILPAKKEFLKPVGEWNSQEVMMKGDDVKIILNGTTIVDGNLKEVTKNGTADGKDHPGLGNLSGHIGFLGHGSLLWFRNIRIKEL